MQVSVIGLGKLGLCIACILSKHYKVIGIDNNKEHINNLNNNILNNKEPKLKEYYTNYRDNIVYTNSYDQLGKLSFIIVPTPSNQHNSFSNKYIYQVLNRIKYNHTVVIVSTVMPETCRHLQKKYPNLNIIYSPTLIALGSIIDNFLNPDLVFIGYDTTNGVRTLQNIYRNILNCHNFKLMSTLEAEIAKLTLNCYITTKITFANQIGNLCHKLNIPSDNILESIGSDSRIGNKYFKAGLGYGGPCFPRDNLAMSAYLGEKGLQAFLFETTDYLNNIQVWEYILRLQNHPPETVIGFEGLSYKRGTDNTERSQLLFIYDYLKQHGYNVRIGKGDVNINWEGICEK